MEEAVAATVVDLDRHRLDGARAAALRNDTASQAKLANCCWAIGLLCRGTHVVAPVAGWPGILLISESVCEKTFPVDGLHVPSSILLLVVHA